VRASDDGRILGGVPESSVDTPTAVLALAGGRTVRPVWLNEIGGVTFELSSGEDRCFVKWLPTGAHADVAAEAARLDWARRYCVVPEVVESGADAQGSWLVTRAVPGTNAVDQRWKREPDVAVRAIGAGLRHLHDSMPVEECPFTWSVEERIAVAHRRAHIDAPDWHRIDEAPEVDKLVVCHGDACAQNTLIGDDGNFTGHVDFGALGVADRWADLAIATWSTSWNYGPGWEMTLLDAYGISPDEDRTRYYRLLWDLT